MSFFQGFELSKQVVWDVEIVSCLSRCPYFRESTFSCLFAYCICACVHCLRACNCIDQEGERVVEDILCLTDNLGPALHISVDCATGN